MAVANISLPNDVTDYWDTLDYTLWVSADDRALSGNTTFNLDVYLSTGPHLTDPHRLIRTFSGNSTTRYVRRATSERLQPSC